MRPVRSSMRRRSLLSQLRELTPLCHLSLGRWSTVGQVSRDLRMLPTITTTDVTLSARQPTLIRCQSDANRIFVSIRELSNCETAIMTTYSLHCAKPLNMFNFAARCYAHARPMTCAVSLWPSVCPSLCL